MVWPCFKVFWSSKDNPTGHSERKKKKADGRRGWKTISKSGQEWTLPAQLGQLKTGQDGKGLLQIHLWCPYNLLRLWDRIENRIVKLTPQVDSIGMQFKDKGITQLSKFFINLHKSSLDRASSFLYILIHSAVFATFHLIG